jgi:hypothetical protein
MISTLLLVSTLLSTALVPPEPPPSPPPDGLRLAGEVGAGILGEALLFVPGAFGGLMLGPSFVDTSACDSRPTESLRTECIDDTRFDAQGQNVLAGVSLGMGLGSGLGVSLAGWLLHGGGSPWLAFGLGTAGGALGLLLPYSWQPLGLMWSAVLALTGAMAGYEVGAWLWGGTPPGPSRSSDLRFTPVFKLTPGGGLLGVSGRF